MGFALFTNDQHYPGTFVLGVSYVTDFFEIGLGGGALVGNKGPCFQEFTEEETEGECRGGWYRRQILGSANFDGGAVMNLLLVVYFLLVLAMLGALRAARPAVRRLAWRR